jgi:glycerophosphoryl diester phosphodiesterase
VDAPGVDAAGITAAHDAGLEVMVWTVNDIGIAQRLADGGVDAMCTDDPAALLAGLRATRPA